MLSDIEYLYSFKLDDYQLEAIGHLDEGKSVVVCAPTGSGKTVIAEYAAECALRSNKRCYYTTPLKALSNQKFYDLKVRYGEEKVGLLTGDISINRDASIVVMTTEVFRNMLYGTILGEVSKNLRNVSCVILDECHYMNDAERGTVWEESIIYAPHDVQLIALSATIANAEELTTWIDAVHGPTSLVLSTFRPVPLRFHYFGDCRIYPLLNPGNGVNTLLKGRFGKSKRFGPVKKRLVTALSPGAGDVLAVLSSRSMLPAIYFLFSRRGCEEAMQRASGIPLVSHEEEKELRERISQFVAESPSLAHHPYLPYLYEGMSVHHAGLLPSWKAMVEKLFQRGLLKVVFATETLAAGINMPARTTVISSLTKRDDEGHRYLSASEFLQMSGRAGRRGMDEVGHVVVLHHPFESVEDGAKLAVAPADPLQSQFTPSYGMVLNLLQRHTVEQARELIERSFGQFVLNQRLQPLFDDQELSARELERLSKPLCPGEIGDLPLYAKKLDAVHSANKQMKQIEKGLRGGHGKRDSGADEAIAALKNQMKQMLAEAYAMPCHGCPVQKPCSKQTERVKHLETRQRDATKRIEREKTRYWRTFTALADILRLQGYLQGNTPTKRGETAAAIRGTNELFLCEVVLSGRLNDLQPAEFAAVMTTIVSEEERGGEVTRVRVSPTVDMVVDDVGKIARQIGRMQRDFDIEIPIEYSPVLAGLTQMWAEGATWEVMRQLSYCDEGDVVRSLRRTVDLCRQFARAPGVPDRIAQLCTQVEMAVYRDEVREDI